MEAAIASFGVINSFNELKKTTLLEAFLSYEFLLPLLTLFNILYMAIVSEVWLYDENGDHYNSYESWKEVRHGCIMGTILFCLAMAPIYDSPRMEFGPEGALNAYSNNVYSVTKPVGATMVAPALYERVGVRIGWGRNKLELNRPKGYDEATLVM
jgi:hypothetical protein